MPISASTQSHSNMDIIRISKGTEENSRKNINRFTMPVSASTQSHSNVDIIRSSKGTDGADEVFHSSWPYFNSMTFLLDKDKPRETLNTITTEKETSNVQNPVETTDENIVDHVDGEAAVTHVQKIATQPTIKKMKKNDPAEERLKKAFSILGASASGKKEETEFQIFGNLIGKKLEKYLPATRNAVQQRIMSIIFNADTGFYEKPISYSTEYPGHLLHPYYPSQIQNNFSFNQNNPAQQLKHLQAPFYSSSSSFFPDTNTTSSTYTYNESLSPASIHPTASPPSGIINVDSPASSFHNSPAPPISQKTLLFDDLLQN